MNTQYKATGCLLLLLLSNGCVQVQTGNDVVDATSAVVTGVYMQKQIDAQKAKSAKPDIFKSTDPKVKELDAAIEKARNRQQPNMSAQPSTDISSPRQNNG